MSIRLTLPQANLLGELSAAGANGVFKSTAYGPASALVTFGLATWTQRYSNGATGRLVITERGRQFKRGEL